MLSNPSSGDISVEQNPALRRLAEALDIAPSGFFNPTVCDLRQTTELLRLWHGITDGQDRSKVLAMVRTVCATTQVSGEPVALVRAVQKHDDGS